MEWRQNCYKSAVFADDIDALAEEVLKYKMEINAEKSKLMNKNSKEPKTVVSVTSQRDVGRLAKKRRPHAILYVFHFLILTII